MNDRAELGHVCLADGPLRQSVRIVRGFRWAGLEVLAHDTEAERAAEPAGAEGGHELHRVFDREQATAIEGAARVLAEQLHRGRVGTREWTG